MTPRPADACPHRRPFPPEFYACPSYRAVAPQPETPQGRSCVHLEVGDAPNAGRFYARCALGTAADRERLGLAALAE